MCGALLTLLIFPAAQAQPPASTAADTPLIRYSATAPLPVIEYTLVHGLLAENDPVPLLRVYGDGLVQVHRPVYMKNSGDFEMRLTPAELDTLLQSLAVDGVMDFDTATERVERQRLAAREETATGLLTRISDDTDTLITVRLEAYRGSAATPLARNLQQDLRWANLDLDARRFPAENRLVRAAAGAQRLRALTEHNALRRIP